MAWHNAAPKQHSGNTVVKIAPDWPVSARTGKEGAVIDKPSWALGRLLILLSFICCRIPHSGVVTFGIFLPASKPLVLSLFYP